MLPFRQISRSGTRSLSTLFQLSEQSEAIRQKCRAFAEQELAPNAEMHDKLATFPGEQVRRLGELGLLGACIDPKHGGSGYDLLTFCTAIEEISRCCASTGIIMSIHNCLYADLVQRFGSQRQIDEFLVPFVSGQIGVFALSEHAFVPRMNDSRSIHLIDAGSDAANLSTTATKSGTEYVLNGRKAWVTSGHEAKAGVFFAVVDKNAWHKGIAAFLVPLNADGVEIQAKEEKLGIRATSTCDIALNNVRIPQENLIGNEEMGFEIAMRQLQLGRIGVGSQALGVAQAAFDLAVEYARKRKIFGEKLSDKQLVKSKLAKMATDLEAARLLLWKASSLRDNGQDFRKLSSMAKYSASTCATSNAHECIQILGAKGFVGGLAERLYRDARVTQIYGGATDIQKLLIADLVIKEARKMEKQLS